MRCDIHSFVEAKKLEKLKEHGKPEGVRVVFWFDN